MKVYQLKTAKELIKLPLWKGQNLTAEDFVNLLMS